MAKKTVEKLTLYCTCGDSANGSGTAGILEHFRKTWDGIHTGTGHEPCDQKTAAKARGKQDREMKGT